MSIAATALGVIRVGVGSAALVVPELLVKRLGGDPEKNAAAIYPLRMFGVRTVFLGAELLVNSGAEQHRVAQRGIVIHGSDVLAAVLAGRSGALPPRAAKTAIAISSINLALALLASRR
ncbi:hypothetical protein GCM10010168_47800 [Actinoplanes ianthinogenes]|uniref:DUF4267 domain-containing protein n=1 Tax=Actinoplanes ianthinogenes TaxID=122358 RepID=A0ABM7LNY2_9ACTN|nr:hypothetical protein [Actinoplanes ianthinogenes]BCJ40920.1 hypothetical protein Aiant_15770 [Actinoplanes ianthinogenes]GGR24219.1 hypothetical protein GCM10010168_47800 [Actinoplanes ianthinogenes]